MKSLALGPVSGHDGMNSFAVEPAAVCASHKNTLMANRTRLLTNALVSEGHTAERPKAKEFILSHSAERCHVLTFIPSCPAERPKAKQFIPSC